MAPRLNAPPNWPKPADGWLPEPGWKPDPSWGPAPEGWPLWIDDAGPGYGLPPAAAVPPKKKNWFARHKFLTGVLALVAVIVIGVAAGGGGDDSPDSAGDGTSADTADSLPGIGTAVSDGKFEFTATRVERGLTTIGEGVLAEEAQGEFVIVYVNVTNTGDESQTLSSTGQILYDVDGRKFEPSIAFLSLPDADKFFLETINPGNSVTDAPLLFDVPTGVVLDRIELHDSMFSGGVDISLK